MMRNVFAKRLLIFVIVVGVGALCIGPLVATVSYEPFGLAELEREEYKKKVDQINDRIRASRDHEAKRPKALVSKDTYDFGMMDPLTEASHAFVIRNEGTESLILTGGQTTCKCTLVKNEKQTILPEQEGTITLSWNSGRIREYYEQTAMIRTNDPFNPELPLKVRGRVRAEIGLSATEVVFKNLEPDGQGTFELDVYSQLFYDFDISSIDSTVEDLVWQVQPLEEDELLQHKARCGYRLALTMPTRNVDSYVSGVLRLRIPRPVPLDLKVDSAGTKATNAGERPEPELGDHRNFGDDLLREIPVRGRMPNRIAFYGPGLHRQDGLDMGIMKSGVKHERRLFLKTRGKKPPSILKVGAVEPSFIQVSLRQATGSISTSIVEIVVPKDAPTHIFNTPNNTGRIEIKSDIAPSGKITLPLTGAVVSKK